MLVKFFLLLTLDCQPSQTKILQDGNQHFIHNIFIHPCCSPTRHNLHDENEIRNEPVTDSEDGEH